MTDTHDPQLLAHDLRIVVGQLIRRLREHGSAGDLRPSQTTVLQRLEKNGPTTKSALAREQGITPQSMGAIIASLEELGFVAGRADPSDGRQTLVELTESARVHFTTGRLAREDWLQSVITAELTDAEQRRLVESVELLRRLARH